jgi:hypothetical protein
VVVGAVAGSTLTLGAGTWGSSTINDTQAQINSKIKMKLLEMDRVKAVWNKYAANKITVTIIKSWKEVMI